MLSHKSRICPKSHFNQLTQKRLLKEIEKLQNDIKNKNYEKPEPPLKPLKLYIEEEYKHRIVRFRDRENDYKVKRTKPLLNRANSLTSMLKLK